MVVSSIHNSKVKSARRLRQSKYRKREGLVLVEGVKHVRDALSVGGKLLRLFVSSRVLEDPYVTDLVGSASSKGADIVVCTEAVISSMSLVQSGQGVVAVFEAPFVGASSLVDLMGAGGMGFVLDRLQDPGNLGAVMRTASACGAGVIVSEGTVDPFNEKVVRSSASTLFSVKMARVASVPAFVEHLKSARIKVVALDACSDRYYFDADLTGPLALVVGNEGAGISQGVLRAADEIVSIPMHSSAESLNAAVAISIVAYEAVRQRMKANNLV